MTQKLQTPPHPFPAEVQAQMDQFSEQLLICLQEISTLHDASDALGQSLNRDSIAQTALAR